MRSWRCTEVAWLLRVSVASLCIPGDSRSVDTEVSYVSEEERRWTTEAEALWRRAMTIAVRHPGMDVSGVYHVLQNLRRTPEERLRRGLNGRLRADRR